MTADRLCVVRGRLRTVPATPVRITHDVACVFAGALWTREPLPVRVQANGQFSIGLPPSSSAGLYTLIAGQSRTRFEVPAQSSAELEDIVVAERARKTRRPL